MRHACYAIPEHSGTLVRTECFFANRVKPSPEGNGVTLRFFALRSVEGNRLEALKGNRAGQHSIRINDKYRVCFVWTDHGVEDVEIVDYH